MAATIDDRALCERCKGPTPSIRYCVDGRHNLWPTCPDHRESLRMVRRGRQSGTAICTVEVRWPNETKSGQPKLCGHRRQPK